MPKGGRTASPEKVKSNANLSVYAPLMQPEFFSSGCTILDCSLNGGWAENRVNNIIGDTSTGKTLLAIIACKMYRDKYPKRKISYLEMESAFDPNFARSLGMPEDNLEFPSFENRTVEALFAFLEERIDNKEEGLIIVDSLDAVTTDAELEAEFTAGYAGARKAERMSALFRQLNDKMASGKLTVIIISQTRDKIGVVYGKKWTRAGGNAMDFYASQILVLWNKAKLSKQVKGLKRVVGTVTTAILEKNKVGPAYRAVDIPLLYYKGIDDIKASVDWLFTAGCLGYEGSAPKGEEALTLGEKATKADGYKLFAEAATQEEFNVRRDALQCRAKRCWAELEREFLGTTGFGADEAVDGKPEATD